MEPARSLVVPLGWSCEYEEPNFNSKARSIYYFPSRAPDTVLTFFNRGFPIGHEEMDRLRELLRLGPDQSTGSKKLSIHSVKSALPQALGNLVNEAAFEMSNVGVVEINGRKTLMIEGTWLASAKRFHGYLLPSDTASGAIQEIFFESEEPNYSKFLPYAQKAINSVKWSG